MSATSRRDTSTRRSVGRKTITRPAQPRPPSLAASALSLAVSALGGSLLLSEPVALLFCALVLAHELGHYVVARAGGFAVSGPIVIFPLGGFVVAEFERASRRERAEAAMIAAGPLSGALFATVAAAYWWATGSWIALAFTHVSIMINLINLIPSGYLDGGRLAALAGVPAAVGWVAAVPAVFTYPWLLLAIAPAVILGQLSWPPDDVSERAAVRRIALTGGLLAAAWLLTLKAVLP